MSVQLSLRPTDWNVIWAEDRRLLRQMAEAIGLKECAYDLDVSPSQLAHALDERERNLPARWIAYLVTRAPAELAEAYLARLCALRGLEVVEAPPASPAEELEDLKSALSELLGPEIRAAILARAGKKRGRGARVEPISGRSGR